jgi:hypothetical protein
VNRNPEIMHAPAARSLGSHKFRLSDSRGRKNPTPEFDFSGLSAQ